VSAPDEADVRSIYQRLIDAWNRRDAAAYAALFDDVANVVGFDGSQMNGRSEIESTLAGIFAHHQTAPYLSIVREVRMLTAEVAILRAVAGMVPPGQTDINPAVNAIQSLVAVKRDGQWRIALFQNTPAQFHGRPELARQLTDELRLLLPH
jgi:uncharacterized protein (TIGR02246 family)